MGFEHMPHLTVSSMDEPSRRRFVERELANGCPIDLVIDVGPAAPERHKPGARLFHVCLVESRRESRERLCR